jgi:hypothetical protein
VRELVALDIDFDSLAEFERGWLWEAYPGAQ